MKYIMQGNQKQSFASKKLFNMAIEGLTKNMTKLTTSESKARPIPEK